jgi:hypothetical protein
MLMASATTFALGAGHYVHWGVISISVTNLAIIASMIALFVLALVVPFGSDAAPEDVDEGDTP